MTPQESQKSLKLYLTRGMKVLEIKERISACHEKRPAILNIKIIYKGKILLDDQVLGDLLDEKSVANIAGIVPKFHLLITDIAPRGPEPVQNHAGPLG